MRNIHIEGRNAYAMLILYMIYIVKEEFEDTKEVIRTRISKKNRQHNGQDKYSITNR